MKKIIACVQDTNLDSDLVQKANQKADIAQFLKGNPKATAADVLSYCHIRISRATLSRIRSRLRGLGSNDPRPNDFIDTTSKRGRKSLLSDGVYKAALQKYCEDVRRVSINAVGVRAYLETGDKKSPSVRTVHRHIQDYLHEFTHYLKRGKGKNAVVSRSTEPEPNEIWIMDSMLLVLGREENQEREWLTTIMDSRTRCVLACLVHEQDPNARIALRLVKKAILPSNAGGVIKIPKKMQTDNGKCFKNIILTSALNKMGIIHTHIPPHMSGFDGILERWHRTLRGNLKLITYIGKNGKTSSPEPERSETPLTYEFAQEFYNDFKNVPAKVELLAEAVDRFVCYYNNRRIHSTTGQIPGLHYLKALNEQSQPDLTLRDIEKAVTDPVVCTVCKNGIEFDGVTYGTPNMSLLRGMKLEVQLPPDWTYENSSPRLMAYTMGTEKTPIELFRFDTPEMQKARNEHLEKVKTVVRPSKYCDPILLPKPKPKVFRKKSTNSNKIIDLQTEEI